MAHGLRFNDKKQFAKTFTQIREWFTSFTWSVLRDLQRGLQPNVVRRTARAGRCQDNRNNRCNLS
jgi:hypothetical protein